MDEQFQSLVDKHKPKVFSQAFGLEYLSTTLDSVLNSKRFNTLLFVGYNGHGKTMIAELFLKRLFCHSPYGLDACLHCTNCRSISDTSLISDIYYTTGEKLSTDIIKEIERWSYLMPRLLSKRVVFIDDIDLASPPMGRLIKGLIDTNGDRIIVLMTATVQKDIFLPLLQRCKIIPVLKLSNEPLKMMIKSICEIEGIHIDNQETIDHLIYASLNTPRIILRALEAIADLGEGLSSASLESPFVHSNLQELTGQF